MENTKKFPLVMLPTEKASKLFVDETYNKGRLSEGLFMIHSNCQHLYILSDEKIKIGDCVKHGLVDLIYIVNKDNYEASIHNKSKKIIATTDKSLGLSLIHDSFLPIFISAYNKGKRITEVSLEVVQPTVTTDQGLGYNECITSTINRIVGDDVYLNPVENNYNINFDVPFSKSCLEEIEKQDLNLRVKTREDNTVFICEDNTVFIHESGLYTREEVEDLLKKQRKECSHKYSENSLSSFTWVKKSIENCEIEF